MKHGYYSRMDQDVKKSWIAALRSGNYRQGNGSLRQFHTDSVDGTETEATYCCLGVLVDLAIASGFGNQVWERQPESYPSEAIWQDWAGLKSNDPRFFDGETGRDEIEIEGKKGSLAALNDDGNDFDSIADAIEKYL